MSDEGPFRLESGILVSPRRPRHRDDEYAEVGFDQLLRMQRCHFWYRGRHKLLLNVLIKEMSARRNDSNDLHAIDMGGGCGGWIEYLHRHEPGMFQELALADSSLRALGLSEPVVGSFAARYQIDLLDLSWSERWDAVFLLDVLEHIPDHEEVLRQVHKSLRPGGLLFVTVPALAFFWTYNDELSQHQRRYCRQDFHDLARRCGLELVRSDYFMFFLSPALLLSRLLFRPKGSATDEEIRDHLARTHGIPAQPINSALTKIFSIEASLVNKVRFPWGTSILAVFRR